MERQGIEWEQLGTHHEHLSVIDYTKEQRTKEVAALDSTISTKQEEVSTLVEEKASAENELSKFLLEIEKSQVVLKTVREKEKFIANNASHYDNDPKYALPEPKPLMYAKTYHDKFALPLVRKLKNAIRSILLQFIEKTQELKAALDRANSQIRNLTNKVNKLEPENKRLLGIERDYNRVRRVLGGERVDELVRASKEQDSVAREREIAARKARHNRDYAR